MHTRGCQTAQAMHNGVRIAFTISELVPEILYRGKGGVSADSGHAVAI
jgi:hypothetical protein